MAPNLYIQRRNIEQQEHEERDGMAAYTDYVCESREITESEEISTEKAIDEYTLQLMEGGLL